MLEEKYNFALNAVIGLGMCAVPIIVLQGTTQAANRLPDGGADINNTRLD